MKIKKIAVFTPYPESVNKTIFEYFSKEDIEILRFFELNIKIKMVKTSSGSLAVDEQNDIKKVEQFLKK